MPALLDTHAFLWLVADERGLSAIASAYLRDKNNRVLLSMVSEWEIALKFGKGRLQLDMPLEEFLTDVPARLSIELLPITPAHLVTVASLPQHHRDPFDRLIAAQSLVEDLPVVSIDAAFDAYGVRRLL